MGQKASAVKKHEPPSGLALLDGDSWSLIAMEVVRLEENERFHIWIRSALRWNSVCRRSRQLLSSASGVGVWRLLGLARLEALGFPPENVQLPVSWSAFVLAHARFSREEETAQKAQK